MGSLLAEEVLRTVSTCTPVRCFSTLKVTREEVLPLLAAANNMPSTFHLRPWQFVIVDDPAVKKRLAFAAMNQQQIIDAPITVVVYVDAVKWEKNYNLMLEENLTLGTINAKQSLAWKRNISFQLNLGPLGIVGFFKKLALPIARLKSPTPHIYGSAAEAGLFLAAQATRAATAVMIAAKGSGFDTCPTDFYDEDRVRRLLGLPRRIRIAMILSIGYAATPHEANETPIGAVESRVSFNTAQNPKDEI
jgi:nitroreductase